MVRKVGGVASVVAALGLLLSARAQAFEIAGTTSPWPVGGTFELWQLDSLLRRPDAPEPSSAAGLEDPVSNTVVADFDFEAFFEPLEAAVPGGSGNFSSALLAKLGGGQVGFIGSSLANTSSGIYTVGIDGTGLRRIVDTTTAVPGGSGRFVNGGFDVLGIEGQNLLFTGTDAAGDLGYFLASGTSLARLDAERFALPGGAELFDIEGIKIDGGQFFFRASFFETAGGTAREGIFSSNLDLSGLSTLLSTAGLPPSTVFAADTTDLRGLDVQDGNVVAIAGTRDFGGFVPQGLYANFGGDPMEIVVLGETRAPDGGVFTSFSASRNVSLDGTSLAFLGRTDLGQNGVYAYVGGRLVTIANLGTADPNGSGNLTAFGGNVLVEGSRVYFDALNGSGQLTNYVANLDGQILGTFESDGNIFVPTDRRDGDIIVNAPFETTEIPEPTVGAAGGMLALLGAAAWRRRPRRRAGPVARS
ncbi:MAG: hypothetical protein KME03_05770 [Aphanocapsa lilacina HA4352-LM1]|jgi:hypothetical protein|nr:hypothetical protein [Aphanocapsa lilacina HA4352-LM1]